MNVPSSDPVAIVDVGSNTIKLLVARRAPTGGWEPLASRTIEARISRGISRNSPVLGEPGIAAGLDAIRRLVDEATARGATSFILVATSAVRSAGNGADFAARVKAATGHPLCILTGDQEANLIGRGLLVDPALAHLRNFFVFDLGGGSLECLFFRAQHIAAAISLPLGCVRLTERFITSPETAIPTNELEAILAHSRSALAASGFPFGTRAPAVFTGGSMTTARAIRAASEGRELNDTSPFVTRLELGSLLEHTAALPLERRSSEIVGLPAARADVFPAALATMLAVASLGDFDSFLHSFYNLRYGIAAEWLDANGGSLIAGLSPRA